MSKVMGEGHLLGQTLEMWREWSLQGYLSHRALLAAHPRNPRTTQPSVQVFAFSVFIPPYSKL